MIYEMPVYDGRTKEWRILNITTGSVYSGTNITMADTEAAIEDGVERAGHIVRRVTLRELQAILASRETT